MDIIKCIPKGKKPKQYFKNWRSICLLNVVFKFESGFISERMKTYMDKIISKDQKVFFEI